MDSPEVIPGSEEDRDITRFNDPPHPTLNEAITAFLGEYDGPAHNVTRIQIGVQGNREVAARVWTKDSEEPEGLVVRL